MRVVDWLSFVQATLIGVVLVVVIGVVADAAGKQSWADFLLGPRTITRDLRAGRNGMTPVGAVASFALWLVIATIVGGLALNTSTVWDDCEARGGRMEYSGGESSCEGVPR